MLLIASASSAAALDDVTVTSTPQHLVFGVDPEAVLDVRTSTDVEVVTLSASVGRIVPAERIAPGHFRGRYVPPGPSFPQFAIIAATANGRRGTNHAWMVLPLWGRGSAKVTGRPNAQVTLRIGDRDFGPVKLDAAGQTFVPIEVPPGIKFGTAGGRRIDLKVPDPPLAHVQLERFVVPAGEAADVGVRVYVLDETGAPRAAPQVELSASRGTVAPARLVSPGVLETRWHLEAPEALGTEQLEARLSGATTGFTTRLAIGPGLPAAVDLQPARDRLVAGEPELAATLVVRDAKGNPTSAALELRGSAGSLAELREVEPGRWAVRWALPSRLDGAQRFTLLARVAAAAAVSARVELPWLPAAPSSVTLSADDAPSRSGEERTLAVEVRDAFGNPVSGSALEARAALGTAGVPRDLGGGRYELRWRAPDTFSPTEDSVQVAAGGASVERRLEVRPRFKRLQASPKLGFITSFAGASSVCAAADATLWVLENLGAQLEVGWFSASRALPAQPSLRGRADFLPVLLAVAARLPFLSRFTAHASLGAGFAPVWASVDTAGDVLASSRGVVPLGRLALGASMKLWGGGPFAELAVVLAGSAQLSAVDGSYRAVSLSAGYRFDVL